jgi:hypothetical protein
VIAACQPLFEAVVLRSESFGPHDADFTEAEFQGETLYEGGRLGRIRMVKR